MPVTVTVSALASAVVKATLNEPFCAVVGLGVIMVIVGGAGSACVGLVVISSVLGLSEARTISSSGGLIPEAAVGIDTTVTFRFVASAGIPSISYDVVPFCTVTDRVGFHSQITLYSAIMLSGSSGSVHVTVRIPPSPDHVKLISVGSGSSLSSSESVDKLVSLKDETQVSFANSKRRSSLAASVLCIKARASASIKNARTSASSLINA